MLLFPLATQGKAVGLFNGRKPPFDPSKKWKHRIVAAECNSCCKFAGRSANCPVVIMMQIIGRQWPVLLLAASFFSCHPRLRPSKVEYLGIPVAASLPKDSSLLRLTQPYRDSVDRSMNQVVGQVAKTLEKRQPEGTLNHFIADAMLYSGRKKLGGGDAAFVNYGGVRINQLPAGAVTRGKIFELMPFDNLLILQDIKGDQLQAFLDMTAERGGWPIAGITMKIRNKKAVDVLVGGKPLDPARTYRILNSDYVANGGDNANMLRTIPEINRGYLMRDAIFDYIRALNEEGKNITVSDEKRIALAE